MDTTTPIFFTDQDFNKQLEQAVSFALAWLEPGDCEELMPHLVAVTLDEQNRPQATLIALAMDFNAQNKYGLLFDLGADFAARLADGERLAAVFGIFEAWMVISQEKVIGDYSEHPDRQEIVSVTGLTTDGRQNAARINISRSEQGAMVAGDMNWTLIGDDMRRVGQNKLLMAFDIGYKAVMNGRQIGDK